MDDRERVHSIFEGDGVFWKPDAPDVKFAGTLKFSQERGTTIFIHGKFAGNDFRHPLVHGLVSGKAVTCHKCFYSGGTGHLIEQGVQEFSEYEVLHLFVGANFIPEQTSFVEMKVSLTGLEEWFGHLPFRPGADETAKFYEYEFPIVNVPAIDAELGFDYEVKLGGAGFKKMLWTARLFFCITPSKPQPFHDYFWSQFRSLQRFLALLTGKLIYPSKLFLNSDDNRTIEVLIKNAEKVRDSDTSFVDMFTRYPEIKTDWPQIVQKWFAAHLQFEPSIILYFSVRYSPVNVQADYLRIMQAVESFRKLKGPDTIIPEKDYEPIQKALEAVIPPAIDPELDDSLRTRIHYGNTITFKKKLVALVQSLPPDLLQTIKFDDLPKIVKQLAIDRDYLTHHDPKYKSKISDVMDLWALGKAVEVALEYLFIKEAGVPEAVFYKRFVAFRQGLFNQPK